MTPQEKHDKFVEAAMMIDCGEEEFSCLAVDHVFSEEHLTALFTTSRKYKQYLGENGDGGYGSFLDAVIETCHFDQKVMSDFRVMLLLFAAQMARTGDL